MYPINLAKRKESSSELEKRGRQNDGFRERFVLVNAPDSAGNYCVRGVLVLSLYGEDCPSRKKRGTAVRGGVSRTQLTDRPRSVKITGGSQYAPAPKVSPIWNTFQTCPSSKRETTVYSRSISNCSKPILHMTYTKGGGYRRERLYPQA